MSLKYTIIKRLFHIIPMQKVMAKPYDELKDPEFTFQTHTVENFPVLGDRFKFCVNSKN